MAKHRHHRLDQCLNNDRCPAMTPQIVPQPAQKGQRRLDRIRAIGGLGHGQRQILIVQRQQHRIAARAIDGRCRIKRLLHQLAIGAVTQAKSSP
jgi:hypothetical protein